MAPLALIEAWGNRYLILTEVKSVKKTGKRSPTPSPTVKTASKVERPMSSVKTRLKKKRHRMEGAGLSDGAACSELARAILKIGEIPERIESSEQRAANDGVGETEDGAH
ncbi:SEQUENCE-SPECIFIC DNA BINDING TRANSCRIPTION FACTOR [Salix viminalis]|uniref:SEQUENCE-SPECIFIC DNA BINDING TRANSCRIPTION FACTOR n=1 Tax=Salix viminalis TaxID=40686 RepID=A0A9Q0TZE7_SALVM|nr:SEQUENCE-SPECIFIC DNA BINDING TRANSCRIPTION FACTOR [Salix viminalis]